METRATLRSRTSASTRRSEAAETSEYSLFGSMGSGPVIESSCGSSSAFLGNNKKDSGAGAMAPQRNFLRKGDGTRARAGQVVVTGAGARNATHAGRDAPARPVAASGPGCKDHTRPWRAPHEQREYKKRIKKVIQDIEHEIEAVEERLSEKIIELDRQRQQHVELERERVLHASNMEASVRKRAAAHMSDVLAQFAAEREGLLDELQRERASVLDMQQKLMQKQTEFSAADVEQVRLDADIAEQAQKLHQLQNQILEQGSTIALLTADKRMFGENLRGADQHIELEHEALAQLKTKAKDAEERLHNTRVELEREVVAYERLCSQRLESQASLEHVQNESQETRGKLASVNEQIEKLRLQTDCVGAEKESVLKLTAQSRLECDALEQSIAEQEASVQELERQLIAQRQAQDNAIRDLKASLQQEFQEERTRMDEKRLEIQDRKVQLDAQKKGISSLKDMLAQIEHELRETQHALNEISEAIDRKQESLNDVRGSIDELMRLREQRKDERQKCEEAIQVEQQREQELMSQLQAAETQLDALHKSHELRRKEESRDIEEIQSQLDVLRVEKGVALSHASDERNSLERKLEETMSGLQRQRDRQVQMQESLKDTHAAHRRLQATEQAAHAELQGIGDELARTRMHSAELESITSQQQAQLELFEAKVEESLALKRRLQNVGHELRRNVRVMCVLHGVKDGQSREIDVDLQSNMLAWKSPVDEQVQRFQFDNVYEAAASEIDQSVKIAQDLAPVFESALAGFHVCVLVYGEEPVEAGRAAEVSLIEQAGLHLVSEMSRKEQQEQSSAPQVTRAFQTQASYTIIPTERDSDDSCTDGDSKGADTVLPCISQRIDSPENHISFVEKYKEEMSGNSGSAGVHRVVSFSIRTAEHAVPSDDTCVFFEDERHESESAEVRERERGALHLVYLHGRDVREKNVAALNECLRALNCSKGKDAAARAHAVPYTSSRLTQLLRRALGGRPDAPGKLLMLLNVQDPAAHFREDHEGFSNTPRHRENTLRDIRYAQKVAACQISAPRHKVAASAASGILSPSP
ncbi:Kinesin-like protein 2 [Porphyridium purpureum]|uniref:Kinesin-like protein 2 n=1 Tax=Porphyridium purpureum TaxID=35688 RepID=A0A5J4Z967_PORPP|nr:Kinesin-like protein 2 [Porphyridium purpureum]|eukprot:POR6759..scf295_1